MLASNTEKEQKKKQLSYLVVCWSEEERERETGEDNKNKWQITNERVSALIIRVISLTFAQTHTHTIRNTVNLYR